MAYRCCCISQKVRPQTEWVKSMLKVTFSTNAITLSNKNNKNNYNILQRTNIPGCNIVKGVQINSKLHTSVISNGSESLNPDNELVSTNDAGYTHFGYQQVKESEKEDKVYEVFENVANSYDVMNDAMSMGVHRLWKTKFVEQLHVRPGMKILDMAGGTGDIGFKILDNFASRYPRLAGGKNFPEIVISDINKEMLDVGKKRAEKLGLHKSVQWVQANAEELPFDDDTFDVYTIAFGIRNATHAEKVLDEAYRVLKVGGQLSCLEFSNVENPFIKELYDKYSFDVIPVMGKVLAGDWQSYKYLVESIRQFPKQDEFADMFYESGFSNVRFENLTFGVVAIHDAFKI